jgi:hypothetical protein
MSHRLQVLVPEELEARLRQAAKRKRISQGEYVRNAIQSALAADNPIPEGSPVDRLARMNGPTVEMDQLLRILDRRYGPLPE